MNRRTLDVVPVVSLLLVAALGWVVTVWQSVQMGAVMAPGLVHIGMSREMGISSMNPGPMATGAAFLGMWVGMMVAMMAPTIIPLVRAHLIVVTQQGRSRIDTVALVAGYFVIWFAIGLLPAALFAALQIAGPMWPELWLRVAAGAVLIVAGAYQFTNLKGACLKACRGPLNFLMTHDFGAGAPGAFRSGLSHGLYCLGCCWALMAVLGVVGFMNLAWMAVLAVIFYLEKNWRAGLALTRVVGAGVVFLGLVVVAAPGLLGRISL